ncbi:MAG: hypothetical protein GTN89_09895 [Acidobacteria bacterium]|nr:hypothetical protein [Acidobacteriota bacterium]NIQ30666.1 hypothetical protein [Acidobacteriota bacterium]NIQ85624.1 hypothetical protein [Acidobacteriota bacterium]
MRRQSTWAFVLAFLLAVPASAWTPQEERKLTHVSERSCCRKRAWISVPFEMTRPEPSFLRWSESMIFEQTAAVRPLWHIPAVSLGDAAGEVVMTPQGHRGQWRIEAWRVTLSNRVPPFSDDHLHLQYRYSFRKKPHRHR